MNISDIHEGRRGPSAFQPGALWLDDRGTHLQVHGGGDYTKDADASHNVAITSDAGRTWTEPSGKHPGGFRSAVAYLASRGMWIATGPSGSDVSTDNGNTWKQFDSGSFNAVSFALDGTGWAVGPKGRVALLK